MIWRFVPRFIKKRIANFFGYFWKDCPICGQKFAGFERSDRETLMIEQTMISGIVIGNGRCICRNPKCEEEAVRRNEELMKDFFNYEIS
jgi:hypothetical protein